MPDYEELLIGVENMLGQVDDGAHPGEAIRAGLATLTERAATGFLNAVYDKLVELGYDPAIEP